MSAARCASGTHFKEIDYEKGRLKPFFRLKAEVYHQNRDNEMAGNFNAMKNRHLTAEQTEKIITAAQNICPIEPTINVATNLSDAEAVAYAHEFVKTFQSAGCLSKLNEGWNPVGAITDVHIFVQQKTYENMHKGAKQLHELFNQVDIDIKPLYIGPDNTLMKEHPFVLAVGANPRK